MKTPRSVGDILSVSSKLSRPGHLDWWTWRELVGERVATRSRPESLEGGTLLVKVASPLWAQELSLLAPLIVEALRKRQLAAHRVRFIVGNVDPPSTGRRVSPPRPAKLPAALEERLAQIDDPAMREAIAEAASLTLAESGSRDGTGD